MLTTEESIVFQSLIPFWTKLKEEEQKSLLKETITRKYEKDTCLYNGSNECIGIIALKTGKIRSYLLSKEGREVTLFRLYAGEICVLSASCLLRNITFDIHVTADTDTELFIINAAYFARLMEENIYVENYIYKAAVDKFSDVMWTMEQILFMSLDQRLAIFLLDESQRTKSEKLTITHSQIATYIGSAREVVSRVLKIFEEDGIVSLSRKGITILNRTKLKKILNS